MASKSRYGADTIVTPDAVRAPYERDPDRPRAFVCTCLTCREKQRVLFEAGRTRPWEHDSANASHVVEYRRIDR
ncbi:hypothetical protein [Haloparvum sedimenti]|uniref:hypothetical protein n=1 Tax=Haloparvum sedimenti TaxID=1678448 RepID=UPI00071E9D08|nr:hypothetical protein [Haloparvum sedimenti]